MTAPALALAVAASAVVAAAWAIHRAHRRTRELHDTRRRLVQARQARDAFFDLTTHELRSPLSAILGYQELLQDGAYGELTPEARDAVERIGRSARHLLHLIDGAAELGRMRAGDVELDLETVDLGLVLSGATESFRSQASERGIATAVEVPGNLPTIRTDRSRLVRALELVVTSAVRHPERQAMELRVTEQDGQIEVSLGPTELEIDTSVDDPAVRIGIRLAVAHRVGQLLGGGLELPSESGVARRIVFRFATAPPPSRL